MYLTYVEYQEMGGTLDETAFTDFEFEAEATIDYYTFNRLRNENLTTTSGGMLGGVSSGAISGGMFGDSDTPEIPGYEEVPKKVKMCVFKIINIVQRKQQAFSLGQDIDGTVTSAISSQSNDGVSISYNVMSASQLFDVCQSEIKKTIQLYLNGVKNSLGHKLLYRGVYPNE